MAAATTTSPSDVSKAWNTIRRGLPVRSRTGCLPLAPNAAKWMVSHPSAVSNSEVSTTQPAPVCARRSSAARQPSAAQTPVPRSSTCIPTRAGGPSRVPLTLNMPAKACTIGS